ncbi:hypothetical protein GOP47_0006762 [Adiantum capillus-veneris]|uniref:Uncharacterized protein n=1 Tax=Adiantum capillus-veneris TaxID=13818 RepID=A0A9D4ZMT1_ADICA|nr:hypothetical protein GOP47_0006762 [Adiantum capillus-veneris]
MKGRLLAVTDPRLEGLFNAEEMKKVIELGLLCVHSNPLRRPSMQQAVQVLMYHAYLPIADLGAKNSMAYSLAENSTSYSFASSSASQAWESVDSSIHLSGR